MNFKVGMHVTYTNPDDQILHGIIGNICEDDPYPIKVHIEHYGMMTFTTDGRLVGIEGALIRLKLRDEL